MLWLKACSRCKGDLFESGDAFGPYVACAQCGKYLTQVEEITLRRTGRLLAAPRPAITREKVGAAVG